MYINYFTKVFQLLGTSPIRVPTVALPLNPITAELHPPDPAVVSTQSLKLYYTAYTYTVSMLK